MFMQDHAFTLAYSTNPQSIIVRIRTRVFARTVRFTFIPADILKESEQKLHKSGRKKLSIARSGEECAYVIQGFICVEYD